jgi:heat-inducible transcriptional repressor
MTALNKRTLEIFKHVVDAFVETGEPIGSKTLSSKLGHQLSSATIRNIMAQLETLGYLYSPHTSAGRLPTDQGLHFFINGLLEQGNISLEERLAIERICDKKGTNFSGLLKEASSILSGLSSCASLVIAPKTDQRIKHVEFIQLTENQTLVVLVTTDGQVENRIIPTPAGIPPSVLIEASNYLNHRLNNLTLDESIQQIKKELATHKVDLNELAFDIIEKGLASWSKVGDSESLIVHGQSKLLNNVENIQDLDRIKHIFSLLETKENLMNLLEASVDAEGVQIFIGSENKLFQMTGCSLVISPFENSKGNVIGALGVIGPTRINYSRIIPMVDYTAKVVSRLLEDN